MSNNNGSNITNNDNETYYSYAYKLVNSCVLPMVMKATINMGVLKLIHDSDHAAGPIPNGLSPAEIAAKLTIRNPNAAGMLDRMLRLLATYSVVRCTTTDGGLERRYSCSAVTKFFIPDDDGVSSLAALLNLAISDAYLKSWNKLEEAVLDGGIPFSMAHDEMNIFEYASVDEEFNEVFNKAMNQTTTFVINKILDKYKGLKNVQQLVDVGGGIGHTLHVITSKYPSIKGINFDLPHVISNASPISNVEHVYGDMFESIPKGDAIFMKWILHDWDDEHCLKLLNNCYKALPENGYVIVVEAMMTDEGDNTHLDQAVSQMDIIMMTQICGGKERSRQEFEDLAKAAEFAGINFYYGAYTFWVMEFYK